MDAHDAIQLNATTYYILYHVMRCSALLHSAVLHYAMLCYTILYYIVLYCTVLYCTVPCHSILYDTTPHCTTLLHHTTVRRGGVAGLERSLGVAPGIIGGAPGRLVGLAALPLPHFCLDRGTTQRLRLSGGNV